MVTILRGDCRAMLRTLPERSIQTCVTSPPYFGLRDYGTAEWTGGDPDCDHEAARSRTGFDYALSEKQASNHGSDVKAYGRSCPCGAGRVDRQIGLEQTPQEYVEAMVAVFDEVWRVLRDDGTLWLNIGDSYNGGGPHHGTVNTGKSGTNRGAITGFDRHIAGLKPKDLIGIPWRVAFALQEAGWYLRSDIIWYKPNCMPSSVTDRPTSSHEHIFLLAKSERYFYDADAIAEPVRTDSLSRYKYAFGGAKNEALRDGDNPTAIVGFRDKPITRNKRDVWTVTTKPYAGAHFATFPPDLVEPCILAGSRPGDTVLDPFAGSGTTCAVALKHHREAIGIELNPAYITLIEQRLTGVQPTLPWALADVEESA